MFDTVVAGGLAVLLGSRAGRYRRRREQIVAIGAPGSLTPSVRGGSSMPRARS